MSYLEKCIYNNNFILCHMFLNFLYEICLPVCIPILISVTCPFRCIHYCLEEISSLPVKPRKINIHSSNKHFLQIYSKVHKHVGCKNKSLSFYKYIMDSRLKRIFHARFEYLFHLLYFYEWNRTWRRFNTIMEKYQSKYIDIFWFSISFKRLVYL